MYVYLKNKQNGKAFYIFKDSATNEIDTLYNFLVLGLKLKPKEIDNFNDENIPNAKDIVSAFEALLGITIVPEEQHKNIKGIDISKVLEKGIFAIKTKKLNMLFIHNSVDTKYLDEIRDIIKGMTFKNLREYLETIIELLKIYIPITLQNEYISKLLTLPSQVDNILIANMPTNKEAIALSKMIYKKPINTYINYYPTTIVPVYINLPDSKISAKLTKNLISVYTTVVKNIPQKIVG